MVEDLIFEKDDEVKVYNSAAVWQNIRSIGEDIVEGSLIIPQRHKIRPQDIGGIIAGGINKIKVFKKPVVGIIPTGDEIVELNDNLNLGDIVEFNSKMIAAQVKSWGADPKIYKIVPDDFIKIKDALNLVNAECDIIIINAGSSAGREDYSAKAIEEMGNVFVHGIAIKPGKPTILGEINGKPNIGVPGYPVSAFFVMENILKPIIFKKQGLVEEDEVIVEATLSKRILSSLKYLEFVRMKLGAVSDKIIATPNQRGAGSMMSIINCDGVLEIPQNVEGYEKGEIVPIKLLKPLSEIKNTLVLIGSHDPILDIASDMMRSKNSNVSLASSNSGSMGGILSLRSGECHLTTSHLLDENTGKYNVSYIKKYLKGEDVYLIKFVKRIQGILTRKSSKFKPESVKDIKDLKLKFVNRQKGSGTRVLFDYLLKKSSMDKKDIIGYEREEFTHLLVAEAIKNGDVDCGIAVYSAASMMGLDFTKIYDEEYDIIVPKKNMELNSFKEFYSVITSDKFKNELDKLGGYDYSEIGTIIEI
ncbi:MAG: molybdopterin biosynthesis protein, partial [Oscillospiraceae bacterium]|nr:molybdopterin biosynthesis protein [Oscillospiraceae bacterium]